MTAVIVSGDAIFSRMLSLELARRGVDAFTADSLGAAIEKKPNTVFLDASVVKGTSKLPDVCETVVFGWREDVLSLGENALDCQIYERPFVVSDMLDATVGKPTLGTESAKRKKSASDGLRLNAASHSASYRGEKVELSKKEFALLSLLIDKKGTAVSRAEATEKIFGGESNVVDVYVKYLRQKIDEHFGIKLISSVRGVGYMIKTE